MLNFNKLFKFSILLGILTFYLTFIYAGGGSSSPPPPPPPCQIQSSGCYKTGDVKADFGSLAPAEFSYFLPEDKCKRVDNCDCKNVPDNIAQQIDPDASSGACSCIARTDWNVQGKCCGGDVGSSNADCGRIASGSICSVGTSEQQSNWISSSANVGDIRHLGCSGAEYLSDGTSWIKCDGTVWKNTINNHEYICTGKGRESIVECCGDGSCNSRIDGKRLITGLSIRNPPIGTVVSPPSATPPSSSPPSTITQTNLVSDVQAIRSTVGESSCSTLGGGWQKFGYDSTSSITYCQKKAQSAQPPAQFINGVAAHWTGDGGGEINCGNFPGLPPVNSEIWQKIIFDPVSDITFCKHHATLSQASLFVDDVKTIQPSPNHGAAGGQNDCLSLGSDWKGFAYNGQSDITFCYHLTTIQSTPPPTTSTSTTPPPTVPPTTNYINITSYCRTDGKFVTELDTPEPNKGDTALNNKNKKTCEAAGFKWTGTKCCSEDDDNLTDQKEYYNDVGGTGGCWNSNLTISVDFVKSTDNSVINYNGEFHGCAIDRRNFNTNNDNLLALRDKHTGNQLITNHDYCFNDPESNYFCSYSERWLPTEGAERIRLSTALISPTTSTSTATITKVDPPLLGSATYTQSNKNPLEPFIRMNNLFRGSAADPVIIRQGQTVKLEVGINRVLSPSYPIRAYLTKKRGSENAWDRVNGVYGDGIGFIQAGQVFERTFQSAQTSTWPIGLYSLYVVIGDSSPQLSSSEELFFEIRQGSVPSAQPTAPNIAITPLPSECCPQDQCWTGASCTSNQKNSPLAQPLNGQRCIDGNWVQSYLKFTPDGSKSGYCPRETQCLIDPFATIEANQCIDSNQYINDNYCENGQWSSRTKLLALKLLKMKSGDFTLFCDTKENTLNNLQYISESGEIVANVLTNLQTNNFCVLKSGGRVIATASINRNLEDIPSNSLNILGVTNCNAALIDDNQYHSCDSANKVWFNKQLKSFIYSATPITVPTEENSFVSIDEFINNPIRAIINTIRRIITTPPFDESYVNAIKKFDRLYITQQGGRTIRGALEGTSFKNAVVEYIGFTTDICNFVNMFNQARGDTSSGISCRGENNNYYVLAQGSQLTNLNPESIWPDLTSKLRLT